MANVACGVGKHGRGREWRRRGTFAILMPTTGNADAKADKPKPRICNEDARTGELEVKDLQEGCRDGRAGGQNGRGRG